MRPRRIGISLIAILALLACSAVASAQDNPPPQGGQINALSTTTCGSGVNNCVIKAAPGNLYNFLVYCSAACFVQVFNSPTAPADGAKTAGTAAGNQQVCHSASAAGMVEHDFFTYPMYFTSGITIMVSSTACGTLTASAVGTITATYK